MSGAIRNISFVSSLIYLLYTVGQFHYCFGFQVSLITLKDGDILNISLSNYSVETAPGQIVSKHFLLLSDSEISINVEQIPKSARYIILQTHAFQYNVTLSYGKLLGAHSYISGTNLGLVQMLTPAAANVVSFYLRNPNYATNVSVLAVVQAYGEDAPIPGGCNMEFSTEIAPYLSLSYTSEIIKVESQPASPPMPFSEPLPPDCELTFVEHSMYHMYVPERDFSARTYFHALYKMMTVEDIQKHARKVPQAVKGSPMRRIYSAYPGTGSVHVAIARYGDSAAAYVPTFTYACSTVSWSDTCDVLDTTFSKILCAVTFFLGLFVCVYGHRYFKTEMFLLGFMSGSLVFYILIALSGHLSSSGTIVFSVILGLCFGGLWLLLWWFFGIPMLSVLLATLTLGFIVASIISYLVLGDAQVLKADANFWSVFSCIMLMVPLLFVSIIQKANMISCAVLGAYAVIIPIDHYIGSNLKYIIVNVIRRATVEGFNLAVIDPPFQAKDVSLCIAWAILAAVGIAIQLYEQRGKPPFPPPPYLAYREREAQGRSPSETTPLLRSSAPAYYPAEEEDVFLPSQPRL